jgi:hypothetical protein
MRTQLRVFGFVFLGILYFLAFFSGSPALGGAGVSVTPGSITGKIVPADTIYSYRFEYGWNDWSADNGVWEVGHPDSVVIPHSGSNCAGTVLNGSYPNSNSRLVSPAITFPSIGAGEALRLRFWHWFKFAGYDLGQVQIQIDSLGVWQSWKKISGDYVGSSPYWTPSEVEISAYAGKRVRIGFSLMQGPFDYVDWGWYLDDVCVTVLPDTVTVASPNGGECWGIGLGLKHTVNWIKEERSGHFQNVKIQLSRDAGRNWETLDSNTYNDGFWQGVIAGSPSDSCLIRVSDPSDDFPTDISNAFFSLKSIQFLRGDANGDTNITVADVVYLVSYLFKGGAVPNPLEAGDANSNGKVTIADAVYLVNFLFKSGPVPACTW